MGQRRAIAFEARTGRAVISSLFFKEH